jgi:hypothetical protein
MQRIEQLDRTAKSRDYTTASSGGQVGHINENSIMHGIQLSKVNKSVAKDSYK